jgi:hypothetical protein
MLRERDRPLYLRELLSNAPGFPVIEVCPCDEPTGEGFLISHPNAVFISCQPNLLGDDADDCLYWALAASANPLVDDDFDEQLRPGNSLRTREFIDAFIEKRTQRGHRGWLSNTILDDKWFHARSERERRDEFVRLFWGAAQSKRGPLVDGDEPPLRIFGQTTGPLAEALTSLRQSLAGLDLDQISDSLPAAWRDYFALSRPVVEANVDWADTLKRSSTAFAVLHGPPAMTAVVRRYLEQSPGIAPLGRVFGPDWDDASLTSEQRQLMAEDRPRFLTELVARTTDFPVLEMAPGDDPVGETSLLHDENALFVSCQVDHPNADDRKRLYWALTAAADPAKVEELASIDRTHASLLRVRNEIDELIEDGAPDEHRAALNAALLGNDIPAQVLRLASGSADRVADAEPLAAALARLRRSLGPAYTPLLKGLAGIDTQLATMRTLDLLGEFPPEWRDYFSTDDEPTFGRWEAALGAAQRPYCVLYGPPTATRVVRSHLTGLPGLDVVGRMFDPDLQLRKSLPAQAAKDSRSRVEDRPAILAEAIGSSQGLVILEVSPGEERHGEEFFLSDPNAVILTCEPSDAEDDEETLLYWAAVTAASKASKRSLSACQTDGGSDEETRRLVRAFVDAQVLPAHREWFVEAVLFATNDERIVRLPWTGARAGGGWQGEEPLPARLARLRHSFGPDINPVADALLAAPHLLAQQSYSTLLADLPSEWKRLFVSVEAEGKVA